MSRRLQELRRGQVADLADDLVVVMTRRLRQMQVADADTAALADRLRATIVAEHRRLVDAAKRGRKCPKCDGEGCRWCKQTGVLER